MKITTNQVKKLRAKTKAGVMDCRRALEASKGDLKKAEKWLLEKGMARAEKRADREVSHGVVGTYSHHDGSIGSLIALACETDFVARTDEFKELAHQLAMQVAAMTPEFISPEDIPDEADDIEAEEACLLLQPYIKNPDMTIQDIIDETIVKVGENIKVGRFARFEVGE